MEGYKVKEIWETCLGDLKGVLPKENIERWMEMVELQSFDGKTAIMGVPSSFVGNWVKERFSDILVKTLERVTHQSDVSLNIVVLENLIEKYGNDNIIEGSSLLLSRKTSGLNPKYTFDTFVVGSSNQFAHAASRAVAESPAKAYNPLFLYSGVGLGKTHLLNAVGHFICNNSKSHMNVTYVSSEHFTNEVINSIRYDKMVDFRNKYRSVDVLLIDDIQFIAGKERTQEEFFHTFNTLYDTNKQIIISSDKYPKEIQNIDDRLRSRYEWGLLADIGPPDFETRVAILRKKADIENIPLPDDVAQYLATHIKTNVRELEGSLIKLGALSSLTKQEINLGMVQETLWYTIQDQKRNVTGEEIQKAVAEHFQLKISDLRSKNRTKTLVVPRHIAMYLCREISKTSFPEIGRLFGGKDHSTVIHACRMIEKLRDTDLATRSLLDSLTKRLKN